MAVRSPLPAPPPGHRAGAVFAYAAIAVALVAAVLLFAAALG